jgi:hypothetical protein
VGSRSTKPTTTFKLSIGQQGFVLFASTPAHSRSTGCMHAASSSRRSHRSPPRYRAALTRLQLDKIANPGLSKGELQRAKQIERERRKRKKAKNGERDEEDRARRKALRKEEKRAAREPAERNTEDR